MIHLSRSRTLTASPAATWAMLGQFMQIDRIAPQITRVEALSQGAPGIGSKRRCHFANGSHLVEEVTAWTPGHGYRVQLQDMDPMPLKEAYAALEILPTPDGGSRVIWSMEFRVKWGPIGWLMGHTMMRWMMAGILDANLQALEAEVQAQRAA